MAVKKKYGPSILSISPVRVCPTTTPGRYTRHGTWARVRTISSASYLVRW